MSFSFKTLSHLFKWKADRTKTVGSTAYDIYSTTQTTPADAAAWFIVNVMNIGGDYPGTTGGVLPCIDIGIDPRDETRMLFRADCSFDSSISVAASPLDEPTAYEYDPEIFEEAYYIDKTPTTAKLARHTNNVPFSTLPTRQASIRNIKITKNVDATNTMATYDGWQDTVNQSSVTIEGLSHAARTLLVSKVGLSKSQTQNGVAFKVLSVELKYKKATWDQKFESLGVQELVSGSLRPITNADGQPISEPWPLQSSGAKAASQSDAGYEIVLKPYDQNASFTGII